MCWYSGEMVVRPRRAMSAKPAQSENEPMSSVNFSRVVFRERKTTRSNLRPLLTAMLIVWGRCSLDKRASWTFAFDFSPECESFENFQWLHIYWMKFTNKCSNSRTRLSEHEIFSIGVQRKWQNQQQNACLREIKECQMDVRKEWRHRHEICMFLTSTFPISRAFICRQIAPPRVVSPMFYNVVFIFMIAVTQHLHWFDLCIELATSLEYSQLISEMDGTRKISHTTSHLPE